MTQMCTNWKGERKRERENLRGPAEKKIRESPIKDYKYKLDEKNEKTKKRDFFFCLSSYLKIKNLCSAYSPISLGEVKE